MVLCASVLIACLLSAVLAAHPQRNLPIIDRVDANSALRTDLNSHLLVSRQVPEESRRLGLTLEPCKTDDDCASPRLCLAADDCSKGRCVCYNRQKCFSSFDCPEGEDCISDLAPPKFASTCASCSLFQGSSLQSFSAMFSDINNNYIVNGLPVGPIVPNFPAMNTFSMRKRFNLEPCTKDEHCKAPRRCLSTIGAESCTPKTCACFSKIDCSIDDPCMFPEACAAGIVFSNVCISCTQIPLNPYMSTLHEPCPTSAPGDIEVDPSLADINLQGHNDEPDNRPDSPDSAPGGVVQGNEDEINQSDTMTQNIP